MRTRKLAASGRPVPGWRQGCFLSGLLVLVGADVPPLSSISKQLLVAHMIEHLLIADVAAFLIVVGLTGPIIAPILRLPGMAWLRGLSHPAVALPVWAINLYLWHLPVLYEGALRHDTIHGLEHLSFFFFAVNLWMALLGPMPKPAWFNNFARLVYIVLARLVGALLGNIFLWSGHRFYAYYIPGDAQHGISQLHDQSLAGSVMMVEESVLTILLFGWLFLRAARQSWERDELMESAAKQGVTLDEERATRAVAAGRTEELRQRLGITS